MTDIFQEAVKEPEAEVDNSESIYNLIDMLNGFSSLSELKKRGIKISTITLDCKLDCKVHLFHFAKYVKLKEFYVEEINYGDPTNYQTNRSIILRKKKKRQRVKSFYNQATILMRHVERPEKYINIKIFKNGSLHVTGCVDVWEFYEIAQQLVKILKRGRLVRKNKKMIERVPFFLEKKKIVIRNIRITMINSNFNIPYKLDRKILAGILGREHNKFTQDTDIGVVEFRYEPLGGHSCVNIKYHYNKLYIPSIFVFRTGSILITGAKNMQQIIGGYEYIYKILNKYEDQIKLLDLDVVKEFRRMKRKRNQIN